MPYRKKGRGPSLGAVIEALEADIARKKALLKSARVLAKILYVAAKTPGIPIPRQRRIKRRRRRKVKAEVPVAEVAPRRRRGRSPRAKPTEVPVTTPAS